MIDHPVDRRDGIHRVLSALFPPSCVLCGAPGRESGGGRDLCAGCEAELPHNRESCGRCGLPFGGPMPPGALCPACQRRAPPFNLSLAAFRYEGAVAALVTGAKFHGRLNVARLLGECLADRVRELAPPRPDALVPVPLHAARQRARGYNQALEIARAVGRELALPVDGACCTRARATPPQAGLEQRARRRNVRGAFLAAVPLPWSHVAIIDDVVTTGSTVAELSRVLRRAGAARVQVWAVARTP